MNKVVFLFIVIMFFSCSTTDKSIVGKYDLLIIESQNDDGSWQQANWMKNSKGRLQYFNNDTVSVHFNPENYGAWQIVYASSGITAYGGYSSVASLYFMANGTNGQRSQAHVNGAGVNAWGSSVTLMMNCVYNING